MKSAGDGMMVVFVDSVADAVACASEMHRRTGALDPADPARLRVGISSGEVAQDGDDFSGMPIVEAARLEAAAAPGQTLANAVVRSLVGTRRALRFRDVGALELKGIPTPLPTVEVVDDLVADAPDLPESPDASARSTRRTRWPLVAGVVALVGALVAVGLVLTTGGSSDSGSASTGVPAPVGYTPRVEPTACPAEVHDAAPETTCSHLVVPQDRSKPQGRQLRLLVTRAPARTPHPGVAPSIDLCGCENTGNTITRDHSEIIQLTGRGFRGSDPTLTCPEVSAERLAALALPANDPGAVARTTEAFRQCHARLVGDGIDPSQFNFAVAARDALDLMTALHIARADFTASELVSAEAFEILRRAPGAVRSVTIDNPAPPGSTGLTDPVNDLAGSFDRYVALCRADAGCVASYPDLPGSWRTAHAQYETDPQLVSASDPGDPTLAPRSVLLDGPRASDALSAALGDAASYPLIAPAIESPAADAIAAGQVAHSDYYSFHSDAPWGSLASYLCAYDVHTAIPAAIALTARTLPQFSGAVGSHWAEWCAAWPVDDVSAQLGREVVSPVPTLLFRGDVSPLGSPSWIREVRRGLSRAQHVEFPTLGDGLLTGGPPCLSDLRRAFLAHPEARLATNSCAKESPPIQFVAPSS